MADLNTEFNQTGIKNSSRDGGKLSRSTEMNFKHEPSPVANLQMFPRAGKRTCQLLFLRKLADDFFSDES